MFWTLPCPSRPGPDLLHRHDSDCAEHLYDECCHCGQIARFWRPETTQPEPVDEVCHGDHESRASSILIGDGGVDRSRCPHCDVRVEPKCISGAGPTGDKFGKGRGDLTDRFKVRLGFIRFLGIRRGDIDTRGRPRTT